MGVSIADTPVGAQGATNNFTIDAAADGALCVAHFEYLVAPSSLTATLGGISLGSPLAIGASTGVRKEAVYVYWLNAALLATVGTGSKSFDYVINGATGEQGRNSTVIQFTGASQSAPTTASAEGVSTAPSASASVAAANAAIISFSALNDASVTITPTSGYTEYYDNQDSSGDARAHAQYKLNPATGSNTVTTTSSGSTDWAHAVVIVEAVAAGGNVNLLAGKLGGLFAGKL